MSSKSSEWLLFVETERGTDFSISTSLHPGDGAPVRGLSNVFAFFSKGLIGTIRLQDRVLFQVSVGQPGAATINSTLTLSSGDV